jgi:membrane fusion protein (multidrug efflux system)
MPQTIDTVEDDSKISSITEDDAAELLKPRHLKSRFPEPRRKALPRWVFAGLGLVFAATAGFSWWLHARHFESTDDAQIDGHINVVSSRISGTVLYVNAQVENNQYVQAGTLLLELDPNDYQAALEHAKSDLATKQGEARSAGVNVPITNASAFSQLRLAEAARDEAVAAVDSEEANLAAAQHRVNQDEAVYTRAERDRVRYQSLVEG